MIGALNNVERCMRLEFACQWLEKHEIGEIVASSLKKEHWNSDSREVFGPLHIRSLGRVKRKSKKKQSSYSIERFIGGSRRGHSTAE